jgi:ADP-ribose pyrophosphatase YjhB (NUDIX family)
MMQKAASGPSVETVPAGDTRARLVCPDCGYIAYSNPKIVVGAICTWQDQVLLCQRAIGPSEGLWTFPAGFMELGETTAQGAVREVWGEALARVEVGDLVGIYEIPHISQVNVIYHAPMCGPECSPGEESRAARLFAWADIPWEDLAFPSVHWALRRYRFGTGALIHTARPHP